MTALRGRTTRLALFCFGKFKERSLH